MDTLVILCLRHVFWGSQQQYPVSGKNPGVAGSKCEIIFFSLKQYALNLFADIIVSPARQKRDKCIAFLAAEAA